MAPKDNTSFAEKRNAPANGFTQKAKCCITSVGIRLKQQFQNR